MSQAALDMKMAQTKAYFEYSPDSVDISVLAEKDGAVAETIQGLFDISLIAEDARQVGSVEPQKRIPHVTFYSGYESLFTPNVTYIKINDVQWLVGQVKCDRTFGTYQGELWLVKVR